MNEISPANVILGNRYRLIHQVGKGGMALVFEGYDQLLERPVAVKLLKQDFSENPEFRERFKQEARAAANLSHPNIVTVHDYGVDPAGVFIVMEYIPGTDLKTRLKEGGVFSAATGLPLIIQACYGLGYAHRAGIVHCDVKPHNMMISKDDRLKITDFGIARALSTLSAVQKSDVVWGSPLYFSPEQALGESPSPASDVYSLGVVMYEVFTGKLPFEANSIEELTRLHSSQPPVPPSQIRPDIPPELEQVILKTLSKDPHARYRTADQLGQVLMSISRKLQVTTIPPTLQVFTPHHQAELTTLSVITPEDYPEERKTTFDSKLIALELLAILAVGGLIPFWLFILLKVNSFLR